jgi:hypothetical protein
MEKLIKTICGLFFILCLSVNSYAGPKSLSSYPWQLQDMPIWCGPLEMVNEALKKEGYVKFEVAFGRVSAMPDGEIAYAVITYASKDIEGHIIRTMETPAQGEKCILEVLFNYTVIETPKPETN